MCASAARSCRTSSSGTLIIRTTRQKTLRSACVPTWVSQVSFCFRSLTKSERKFLNSKNWLIKTAVQKARSPPRWIFLAKLTALMRNQGAALTPRRSLRRMSAFPLKCLKIHKDVSFSMTVPAAWRRWGWTRRPLKHLTRQWLGPLTRLHLSTHRLNHSRINLHSSEAMSRSRGGAPMSKYSAKLKSRK